MKKLILLAAFCVFFTGGLQAASYHGLYRGNYYLESHRSGYYYETGFFVVHVDKSDRATVWLGSTYANNNADEQAVEKLTFSLNSEGWGKFRTHNRYYVSCQVNPDGTITVASLEEDVDIFASDTEYVPWTEYSYESGKYTISGKVSQYGYSISVGGEALILPDGDSYLYLTGGGVKVMERIGLYSTGYSVAAEPIVSLDYVSLQVGKLQLKVHYVEPVDNITVDLTLTQRESFFDTDADGISNYDEIAFGTDETLTDTDKDREGDVYEYLADFLGIEDISANTPQLGIYSFGDEYFSTTIVPSSKTGAAVFVEEDVSLYEGEELELIEAYLNKKGLYLDENLRLCYTFNISWDKNGRIKASDPYGDVLFGLMSSYGVLGISSVGTSGIWPHDVQNYFTAPDELLGLYQGSVTYEGKRSSVYMILYGNGEYTLYTSLKSKSYKSTTGTYYLTTTGDNQDLAIAFSGLSVAEGNYLNGVVAEIKGSSSSMKIDFNARKSDIVTDVDVLSLSRKFDLNDSDRDGLSNWEEINTYRTDPLLSDTDRDGQSDAAEIEAGTDANDKSVFPASIRISASPASGLKLTEYYELKLYLNNELYEIYPLDRNGRLSTTIYLPTGSTYSIYATVNFKNDPSNPLPPGDDFVPYTSGTPEVVELTRSTSVKLILDGDMDGDGLLDSLEAKYKCDPTLVDTDGDGLTDAEEVQMKLKPYLADSDKDGYADNIEVALGTDPLKKNDAPVAYAEQFVEISLQLIYTDENGIYQAQILDTAGFCQLLAEIAQVDNPTGQLIIRSAFTEDKVDEIWMLTTDSGPKEINRYIFPIKISGQRSYLTAAADEDLVTHHVAAYEIKNSRTKIGLTVIADGDYEYSVQDYSDFSVLLMKAQTTPTRISGIFEHPDLTPRDQPGILRGTFTYQGESSWFGPDNEVIIGGDTGGTPPPGGSEWELPVFPPVGGTGNSYSSASMGSASGNTLSIPGPWGE